LSPKKGELGDNEGVIMDEITIVDVQPQLVAGITKTGSYKIIAELLPKLYQYAASKGAQFNGPPLFLCHEVTVDKVMEADKSGTANVEVVAPIASEIPATDEIKCYTVPGGKMAKTVHKGPYQDCGPTYEKLYKWIEEKGKKINGPVREAYLNDPNEVGEEEALTEIYAPIE
jgi:effector-binding domain-containing protein